MPALRSLLAPVADHRREMLRIALQTGIAAAATYLVITSLGLPHLSWALVAALFTIGLSADASFYNAAGRIGGAFLGVGLGLGAAWAVPGPVLPGLVLATAAANAVATVWPTLRYAAVTAAIVALEAAPEAGSALERAGVILLGTLIGAGASLAIWPVFGRQRVAGTLEAALVDCQDLLGLIVDGVDTDDRRARDAVHARFLRHLEAARADLARVRFRSSLPSGVPLRDAVVEVESLWHTLVILDRAVSDERHEIGPEAIDRLRPKVRAVQRAARDYLSDTIAALAAGDRPARTAPLTEAVAAARAEAERLSPCPAEAPRAEALAALGFALGELGRRAPRLGASLGARPDAAQESGARRGAALRADR